MTKKKIEQLIDEKVRGLGHRPVNVIHDGLGHLIALYAGATLNKVQMQEIREQLDGIKWRLVEIEDELRRQPKVRIYWAPATAEQITKSKGKRGKATK